MMHFDVARRSPHPRGRVRRSTGRGSIRPCSPGWMGPDDCSVTVATVDERVGGAHHLEMLDGGRQPLHVRVRSSRSSSPTSASCWRSASTPSAEATTLTAHVP